MPYFERTRTRSVYNEALQHCARKGGIGWDKTHTLSGPIILFNPWLGCTKVSPACANCYAEAWAKRTGIVKWGDSAERRKTTDSYWRQPLKWNAEAARSGERKRVFCASLADVFEDRPELEPWRRDLMRLILGTHNLDWLLLTKRPENILRMMSEAAPRGSDHLLRQRLSLGTTVESQDQVRRIDYLVNCRMWARVLFLSCEPLLGPLDLFPWLHAVDETAGFDYNAGIDWVIAGGESGGHARPSNPQWFRDLRDQCEGAKVPFHFKQWGEFVSVSEVAGVGAHFSFPDGRTVRRIGKKNAGRLLDGREWNEFPKENHVTIT